ncbi:MAG TPA: biotin synthase BioB [Abditibacteriaceae bacterium]|jgi:biotin synthase
MNFHQLADQSLRGEAISRDDARAILDAPASQLEELLEATSRVREQYFGRRVKICVLLNAQSGICPEDCNYCSQSKISKAEVEKYKLLPAQTIVERAQEAASAGANRFCMVIAARGPQPKDIATLAEAARQLKANPQTAHMELCTSLGLMTLDQCQNLAAAGIDYVNHNLNTSEEHYAKICSTHTYADRVQTLENVQASGMKTCSGGIVGMGETPEDIIEMAFKLREMQIESIPINFLLTIPGTPLQSLQSIDPNFGLKVLCLVRLLNPDKEVRMAAGREVHLRGRQEQALRAANSLFVDGYLTTPGQGHADVKNWIEAAGYVVEGSPVPVVA